MQLMGVWSASVSSAPHYLQIQYCLFKHSEQRRGFFCLNQAALLLFMEPGYTSQCFSPAQLLILSVSSQTNYRKSCIWSKYKDNDAGWKTTPVQNDRVLSVNVNRVLLLTLTNSMIPLIPAWQMSPTLPPPTTNTSLYVALSPTSIRSYYVIWYRAPAECNQEVLQRTKGHPEYIWK